MTGRLLAIAAGGAAGALLRFGLAGWVQHRTGAAFPWGTLAVNLAGCFCIGLLAGWFQHTPVNPWLRDLLMVGLLGAMTTFSTFSLESLRLLRDGEWLYAAGNVFGSCAAGLALALLGLWAGEAIAGTPN